MSKNNEYNHLCGARTLIDTNISKVLINILIVHEFCRTLMYKLILLVDTDVYISNKPLNIRLSDIWWKCPRISIGTLLMLNM